MSISCEVCRDLLPLYIDGVCSLDSMRLVEDHFRECAACRMEHERMTSREGAPATAPDAAAVIKKTARDMTLRSMLTAAGFAAIIIYWVIYAWESAMSKGGDYRYFSYGFHELWTGGVILTPIATGIWLLSRLWKALKRRSWRRSAPMLLLLAALLAAQLGYIASQPKWTTSSPRTMIVERIDEYHVTAYIGDENENIQFTLEAAPNVVNLLEEGGEYYITFSHDGNFGDAKLLYVHGPTPFPTD